MATEAVNWMKAAAAFRPRPVKRYHVRAHLRDGSFHGFTDSFAESVEAVMAAIERFGPDARIEVEPAEVSA